MTLVLKNSLVSNLISWDEAYRLLIDEEDVKLRKSPKPKLMVKDILTDLEKAQDVKERVSSQINKGSGMSPMGEATWSPSIAPSLSWSSSTSISEEAPPSVGPGPWRDFDYSETRGTDFDYSEVYPDTETRRRR